MSQGADLGLHHAVRVETSLEVHHEIGQFLYREAALLDARDFTAWLNLFAPDVHYWVPVRTSRMPRESSHEFADPAGAAFFDEDLEHLRVRVRKLETDRSWSEVPASRTRHLVTNLRTAETTGEGVYRAEANLLVYRSRADDYEDLFSARRVDLLRRTDEGSFLIVRRHVFLDHTVLLANNLTIFF